MIDNSVMDLLKVALKSDPKLTPEKRNRILAIVRQEGKEQKQLAPEQPRLVRRNEAARMVGRTPRTIDAMCQDGLLRKVKWKGRKHCAGITLESIMALIRAK